MKYPIKSIILVILCCAPSLLRAAEVRSSRNTNPALLYWQAAAELPPLSEAQARQLREIADGKIPFKAEIIEEFELSSSR